MSDSLGRDRVQSLLLLAAGTFQPPLFCAGRYGAIRSDKEGILKKCSLRMCRVIQSLIILVPNKKIYSFFNRLNGGFHSQVFLS